MVLNKIVTPGVLHAPSTDEMPSPGLHAATTDDSLLEGLLGSFDDVFVEPKGLPPARARDHHIVLKPDAAPVAVRPYRYPAAHR